MESSLATVGTGTGSGGTFRRMLTTMHSGISSVQASIYQRQGNSTFYAPPGSRQPHMCGWLRKQGGMVKTWHRRWFVMKGDCLLYFSSEDDSRTPLGMIDLPGNRVVEHPRVPNEPDRFLFDIVPGGDKSKMSLTHETYPLCANSEDERKDWIRCIRKVIYADVGGAIFGQSLDETMAFESKRSSRKVPLIVEMCVDFIIKQGLEVEGIFRLPGRTALVRQLRETFDSGEPPLVFDPSVVEVNTVASLLKNYLRELPQPIIPHQFYESVMKLVQRDLPLDPDKAIARLSKLLCNIPPCSYNLLQYLCQFLHAVSQHADVHKMTPMNLATVFMQSIVSPEDDSPELLMGTTAGRTQVAFVLISEFENIFKMEYTIDGTSVMVDTLLDIGVDEANLAPTDLHSGSKTSMHYNLSNDLMGLDLGGSDSMVEGLAAPLMPMTSESSLSTLTGDSPRSDKGDSSRSDQGDSSRSEEGEENDDVEQDSDRQLDSAVETPKQQDLSSELDWDIPHENGEIDRYQSMRLSNSYEEHVGIPTDLLSSQTDESDTHYDRRVGHRRKNGGSKFSRTGSSKRSGFYGAQQFRTSDLGRSISMDSVPSPPPRLPPRPVKYSTSSESVFTDDSGLNGDQDEDEAIDALIQMDMTGFTDEDLKGHVDTLGLEVRSQWAKVKQLRDKVKSQKHKHTQTIQEMAAKLDSERNATAEAVDKVLKLQQQLQSYQMTYGCVDTVK